MSAQNADTVPPMRRFWDNGHQPDPLRDACRSCRLGTVDILRRRSLPCWYPARIDGSGAAV